MAKPLQKERENRSAEKKDLSFHSYMITPETANTAVLLLESKEPEILCQTLRAITKFAAQDWSNREILFKLNAIKYVLPHIDHAETNIRRFACKALAQLAQLPKGTEQILQDPQNLRRLAFLIVKSDDVYVLEFASLVISELTKEPAGCEQLIGANILTALFKRMKESFDPDVQKNCLQCLSNVLQEPVCAAELTKNPQFQWLPLLALMQSKFIAIQTLALKTVDQLLGRYKDYPIQKSFKSTTGILDLCDILEALFETGTDLVFCHHLLSSNMELLADCAMGVANMCKLSASSVRMAETNIIDALSSIIADEAAAWFNIRINCILAMSVLGRIQPKCAAQIVEQKPFTALRNVYKKSKDTPVEAERMVMQCYLNIQVYNVCMKVMVNSEFIKELLDLLQNRIDIQLKIMVCKVLTGLMSEEQAKYFFTARKGEKIVSSFLPIQHVGLRTALCMLIAANVTDDNADIYVELGTVQCLVEDTQARYTVCAWEPALEAIFNCHPSAKFAYTGRLNINDFATEGFYVLKRLGEPFPTLQECFAAPPPHTNPVIVAMFYPSPFNRSVMDIRTPRGPEMEPLSTMQLKPSMSSRLRLQNLPDDTNLRMYLVQLKIWLGDPAKSLQYLELEDAFYEVRYREKCTEVSTTLKTRAQMLGDFVAQQMSGLTQERDCSLPCVEIALGDLMLELKSRVVGLGWIKCGGALERAILYKVLADRMGLPCALYRGSSAHAWVEVAVPEIDPEDDPDTIEKFPAGLLRANYIVDLMDHPGRLIPRTSHIAARICGPYCAPLYTARRPTTTCKCPSKEPVDSGDED